jgi:hypothetical protein
MHCNSEGTKRDGSQFMFYLSSIGYLELLLLLLLFCDAFQGSQSQHHTEAEVVSSHPTIHTHRATQSQVK